jgi:N-methylhydantoinase A
MTGDRVAMEAFRIAVDIGGTFTDGVAEVLPEGRILLAKRLTTQGDPSLAVAEVVADLLVQLPAGGTCDDVVHGTTLVTNAIIERKGAKVALIVTRGTGDVLDIGREVRYDLYDLELELPVPLAPPELRHEVVERLDARGRVLTPLDDAALEGAVAFAAESGAEAVAVCLLHAYLEPRHEAALGRALAARLPDLPISLSSRVAAEVREYERMSTAVANAYVQPLAARYVARLKDRLQGEGISAPLRIMVSSGGFTSDRVAAEVPIVLLESGPAGGVMSAVNTARGLGIDDVITFDMGGTTAKACVAVGGRPAVTHHFEAARVSRFKRGSGLPILAPSIDLIEIGAGGGSIARLSELGLLRVGPESAGAEPGPACYGQGGTAPTVTDADLLLGYLDAEAFLGGRMRLDREAAARAVAGLAERLGLDATATAWGIHDLVNENMAGAARVHIAERGLDPRRLTMVATGGAGPVHAVEVAAKLGLARVLFTVAAGVGSCLGFLAAPARVDRSWSNLQRLDEVDWREVADGMARLAAEIEAELASSGIAAAEAEWTLGLEARYAGQGATVLTSLPYDGVDGDLVERLAAAFLERYRALYGAVVPGAPVQAVTWRLTAQSRADVREFRLAAAGASDSEPIATRPVYLPARGAYAQVPVYARYALAPESRLDGPLILQEDESTIVVARSAAVAIAANGTVSVALAEEA